MDDMILQGDVFLCDLGEESSGCEQNGIRPCLVVSNNLNNKYSSVIIVIPITSKIKKDLPMHYILKNKDYGFFDSEINTVLTEQIRCVSIERLIRKIGRIDILDLMHIINKLNINFKDIELY
jgi:mRNA interferase MazF